MSLSTILQRLFGKRPSPPQPQQPVIQPEERSIDDMVFGAGVENPLLAPERLHEIGAEHAVYATETRDQLLKIGPTQVAVAVKVRDWLRTCGVTKAKEINTLGCTGAVAAGMTVDNTRLLIIGLGGGGFGLPCFVPRSRYCLVHNTIGGLQEGQKPWHTQIVEKISRELTDEERGKVKLIEASRRIRGKDLNGRLADTIDALSGEAPLDGFEKVEVADGSFDEIVDKGDSP